MQAPAWSSITLAYPNLTLAYCTSTVREHSQVHHGGAASPHEQEESAMHSLLLRIGQVMKYGAVLRHVLREGLHMGLLSAQSEEQAAEGSLHLHTLVLDVLDAEHAAVHDVLVVIHQRGALGP